MDRLANHGHAHFNKKFERSLSETYIRTPQKTCGNGTSNQSLKSLFKRVQEKKRSKEDQNESKETASISSSLESLHVQRVYDQIAPHIEDLKQKTWPRVKEFLKSLKAGSLLADIGCGNGRYLHINPSIMKIGSDVCQPFLNTAASRGFEVLLADNLFLPYRDNTFDAAVSIGVIHHFASKERRVRALKELVRILQPGGLMMVYVWAFEQKYRKFDGQDILVPWHKPSPQDTGCRRIRTSSLSEVDRFCARPDGRSLSGGDLTPCHCQDVNNAAVPCSQPAADAICCCTCNHHAHKIELSAEDSTHDPGQYDRAHNTQSCCANKVSSCAENGLNLTCIENELNEGEALIKECQKVESFLSNLCKNPWEFVPKRSVSSLSALKNNSSFGSFEESALTSTTKSSPSCQSLSFQDDDVFVDKSDSPFLDKSSSLPTSPSGKPFSTVAKDPYFSKDTELFTSKELLTGHTEHRSLSLSQNKNNFDAFLKDSLQKYKNDLSKAMNQEGSNCIGDFNGETGAVSVDKTCHTSSYRVHTTRGMLDVLKQGLKSIFSKSKPENGRQSAACFMPCLTSSLPQEHFQIREFPLSSLPPAPAPAPDYTSTLPANMSTSEQCQTHCQENGFMCQTCLNNRDAYHTQKDSGSTVTVAAQDASLVGTKLDVHSSDLESEITNHNIFSHKKSSSVSTSSFSPTKSKRSKSFKSLSKLDAINTDLCRFYHVFREGELEELIAEYVPGVKVVDSFYDHANWCVILEKV